jgi:26S proteasome non-ATPase regulatory subunit 10
MDETLSMIAYKGAIAKLEHYILTHPGVDLSKHDEDKRTPLHWASAGGNMPVLRFLLEQDGLKQKCINNADESGMTPIMSAVAAGHVEVVRLLLDCGGTVNTRDEQGATALHFHKGRIGMIELLLPHVKNINAADELGTTPLHRAAGPGFMDACQLLLSHGAKINAQDATGCTPLHYAAEEGRAELVSVLLENGARADVTNKEGKSAMDVIPRGDDGIRVKNVVQAALASAAGR